MAVVIDELQSTVEPEARRAAGAERSAQSEPVGRPVEELGAELRRIVKRQTRLRAD
jgi:hypothetical protein